MSTASKALADIALLELETVFERKDYADFVHTMTPAQLCASPITLPGSNWVNLSPHKRGERAAPKYDTMIGMCPHCGFFASVRSRKRRGSLRIPDALFSVECQNGLCAHRATGVLHECAEQAVCAWNRRDMTAIVASLGQFTPEQLRDLAVAAMEVARFTSAVQTAPKSCTL